MITINGRCPYIQYKKAQDAMNEKSSIERDMYLFNDEVNRKAEIKRLREKAELEQFKLTKSRMLGNKDKREDMRHQDVLRAELKLAYKQGDTERVQRLERVLAPDVNIHGHSMCITCIVTYTIPRSIRVGDIS